MITTLMISESGLYRGYQDLTKSLACFVTSSVVVLHFKEINPIMLVTGLFYNAKQNS